ncbi:hypothetical protein HNQ96_004234 [Aminobacter lissarensis]|uniref:Uncharacterized protein n=1 Tax=Aminobacter carboxidus TaxID=376165 RepID=A0A8E1WJ79_9HYPH|nr:hypothetical protein [Aminobacter lissarensis]MBB6468350.1 hypothetical protein [Aminobacter lissarensis]
MVSPQLLQSQAPVGRLMDMHSRPFQRNADHVADIRVVIDNKNAGVHSAITKETCHKMAETSSFYRSGRLQAKTWLQAKTLLQVKTGAVGQPPIQKREDDGASALALWRSAGKQPARLVV